ncbi:MAG TPA: hypothetical protein VJZ76_06885 [Thermoanaerobaculia bacterium]|nr:hypothetical protein [Thermoanaerobaculia bacterium]
MELNGHNIVILREPRIVSIDGVPHRYGIAGDCYYLERNPRDRAETLLGAVRHYLDYVTSRPEPLRRAC